MLLVGDGNTAIRYFEDFESGEQNTTGEPAWTIAARPGWIEHPTPGSKPEEGLRSTPPCPS